LTAANISALERRVEELQADRDRLSTLWEYRGAEYGDLLAECADELREAERALAAARAEAR
jgi:hypothetical protein